MKVKLISFFLFAAMLFSSSAFCREFYHVNLKFMLTHDTPSKKTRIGKVKGVARYSDDNAYCKLFLDAKEYVCSVNNDSIGINVQDVRDILSDLGAPTKSFIQVGSIGLYFSSYSRDARTLQYHTKSIEESYHLLIKNSFVKSQ